MIKIKKCSQCGTEVDIFSNEMQAICKKYGFTVYKDLESCGQGTNMPKIVSGKKFTTS